MTNEQIELQKAAELRTEAQESFDRCDTDGFVSQWANGILAQKHEIQAEIERNGGTYNFSGLYEGARRVAAKVIQTKFGLTWILRDDEAAKFGRKFIPVGSESRVQKKLGIRTAEEMAPAKAVIRGTGHGLSGTAWACARRTGEEWGQDAKRVN